MFLEKLLAFGGVEPAADELFAIGGPESGFKFIQKRPGQPMILFAGGAGGGPSGNHADGQNTAAYRAADAAGPGDAGTQTGGDAWNQV